MKLGVFYCATSKISEPATEHQPKSTPNDIRQRHLYAQSKRFWIIYYVISVVSTPHFPNIRPKSTPISFPRTLTFIFLPTVIPVPNTWAVTESSLSPTPVSTPSPTFPSKPCAITSARWPVPNTWAVHFPNIRPQSTPISFPRTLTFIFLPTVIPVPNTWAVTESSLSPTPVSTPSPTFPSKPCAFTSARLTEALTPAPASVFQAPAFASKKSASSSPFPAWRMDAFASALFCFSSPPSSIALALA